MADVHDLDTARRTYESMLTWFKWGAIASFAIGFAVIMMIS